MTTTGPETAPFTAETFQNEYLATGVDTVDAVVTVAAAGEAAEAGATPSTDRAEVVIFDTSGSMGTGRKMAAAKEAAAAAVDSLDDGVSFAVIAGDHEAKLLWPQDGRSFAVADADDRAGAKAAIARAEPAGGTAIGTWLDLARQLFGTTTAPARHAILLTDGRNEHQQPYELQAAIAACRGLFQCDCRGVGPAGPRLPARRVGARRVARLPPAHHRHARRRRRGDAGREGQPRAHRRHRRHAGPDPGRVDR